MFLTKDEIRELTGRKFKSLQIKWLQQHNYKYDIAADGSPKVLRVHVEYLLGGSRHKIKPNHEPDFSDAALFG